jgi:arginyl-tRNA synthetase
MSKNILKNREYNGALKVFLREKLNKQKKELKKEAEGFDNWLRMCYNSVTTSSSRRNDMASEKIPLSYKGHPLRRKDNLIYYGTMAEKYIIMLQILATQKVDDMDVATKVSVQLQLTDPDLKSRDRVVKKSEKDSLYAAMDVASVWLERALSGK